jgi:hypothetical protein
MYPKNNPKESQNINKCWSSKMQIITMPVCKTVCDVGKKVLMQGKDGHAILLIIL